MDLLQLVSKPIRVVKGALDFDTDLESPSFAAQFAAAKHQLAEVEERLRDGERIARERDAFIAKCQKARVAETGESQLQDIGRQVAELQQQLAESQRAAGEKDTRIAELQARLAAQVQERNSASVAKTERAPAPLELDFPLGGMDVTRSRS